MARSMLEYIDLSIGLLIETLQLANGIAQRARRENRDPTPEEIRLVDEKLDLARLKSESLDPPN